ncbi:hypothetical protein AB0H18_45225 [Streptomyces sp. NPDC020766]|uniref:hypothetical protein n=1 Tax=Streptomyces sp. NPDC020766 TaxID=3155011 RepID=UPI003405C20D
MRRRAVAAAAVALLSAPVLTGSSLTGTASAAESAETAGTTVAAGTNVAAAAAKAPVYARLYNQATGKCLAVRTGTRWPTSTRPASSSSSGNTTSHASR